MIIRCASDCETIRINLKRDDDYERNNNAAKIEMWYDRHRKEWVLYPVDKDGNQMSEASYGFGKKDAIETKKHLEEIWGI